VKPWTVSYRLVHFTAKLTDTVIDVRGLKAQLMTVLTEATAWKSNRITFGHRRAW